MLSEDTLTTSFLLLFLHFTSFHFISLYLISLHFTLLYVSLPGSLVD